ncbi:type VII secretion integral membrane protein EccD [Rhizocola hellebori]|uniref:Type VII secretion integral membrane protein EccD n=1 Tax=Rhizocola hellebori TaxID=1392758 RepID=A0A8J3QF32_9ACTN|nr:type VII secretion integral membrane protein EccD [Rhizocola hellebori]GIH09708.1 type VII secretion integral membrane protein EccD [Rhizocola hellebori]
MASVGDAGLSRITLVAPRTRIDLALPSDVPLADLLPTLLHYAGGEEAGDGAAAGWALSRLGGMALDSSRTPFQLEVRDGELLYLRPHGGEAPMLLFDDVVDAVATATNDRPGRWVPAMTRLFGLTLGAVALLGGAAVLLFSGPPQLLPGLIGLATALVMLVTAVILARAVGDSGAGVVVAAVAMVYAAVGGLLITAEDRSLGSLAGPHVLLAVTAVLLVTVVAAIGVVDAAPFFLAIGVVTVALQLTAAVCLVFGVAAPAAAAIVATFAFATLPALPMFAYRLARLPIPTVPTEAEALKSDTETVDGARVLQRSARAEGFLTGMLGAVSLIGAAAAVSTSTAGTAGVALAAVLGLVLMARARLFRSRAQRLCLLCCGAIALGATILALFLSAGYQTRLTAILGVTIAIAAISIGFGLARRASRRSPIWGRLLDLLEIVLILGLVPLAMWVCGLYAWIRTIRG